MYLQSFYKIFLQNDYIASMLYFFPMDIMLKYVENFTNIEYKYFIHVLAILIFLYDIVITCLISVNAIWEAVFKFVILFPIWLCSRIL